jgi:L-fuculose-phosphate aldolase
MLALGGPVRVAPYATFGTPELAEGVVAALEGRAAALMRSHGAVCVGAHAAGAAELTLLLEWACTVYWRARALGDPHVLTDAELNDVVSAVTERGYGATKEID